MTAARGHHTRPAWPDKIRHFVGGFYLTMAGVNIGIVFADADTYRHFADPAALDFVRREWTDIVMANPSFWGLLLAAGELGLGVLLLTGGPFARAGWLGVIVFHLLLMLFGPSIWWWCVPVLAGLVPAARADWPALSKTAEIRALGVTR